MAVLVITFSMGDESPQTSTWTSRDQHILADRKPPEPCEAKSSGLTQTGPLLASPFQASAELHTWLSVCVNPEPLTYSALLCKKAALR